MSSHPPVTTLTDTLFPYTTLFRSARQTFYTLAHAHALSRHRTLRLRTSRCGRRPPRLLGAGRAAGRQACRLPAWRPRPRHIARAPPPVRTRTLCRAPFRPTRLRPPLAPTTEQRRAGHGWGTQGRTWGAP